MTTDQNEKSYSLGNIEVINKGKTFILPDGMDEEKAADYLLKVANAKRQPVKVHEIIRGFPFDAALCFMEVLQEQFGWATPVPTPGFFGDTPPTMMEVQVSHKPNDTRQIFWGDFILPSMDGCLTAAMDDDPDHEHRKVFIISGTVRKKDEGKVKAIVAGVREKIATTSVYRGQAIKVKTTNRGQIRYNTAPDFLDVSGAKMDELIFSDILADQIQTNLFTPIVHTEACRNVGVPLKRGVLLEGKYGTGKTQTAYVTAKLCTENNWTFIMVDEVAALAEALELATLYSPAVVFAEDIDRATGGLRRSSIDTILNTLDGVATKEAEIITILTTNDVDAINKAMLRPGRLDAVLTITPPDGPTAVKLARQYSRGLLDATNIELVGAGKEMDGMIPAVIREVCERAKLWAVGRAKGDPGKLSLSATDLVGAAQGMKSHLKLLEEQPKTQTSWSIEDRIADAAAQAASECVSDAIEEWNNR